MAHEEHLLSLLSQFAPLIDTVEVQPSEPFRVVERFVKGNKKSDLVNIFELWQRFTEVFDLEVEAEPKRSLKIYTLLHPFDDRMLRSRLGVGHETYFSDFWALLVRQGKGQKGTLITNGKGNLFYIKDVQKRLWVVGAHWYVNQGWLIPFSPLDAFPHDAGSRVISR